MARIARTWLLSMLLGFHNAWEQDDADLDDLGIRVYSDHRGFAAEGIVSNLFLVRDGTLCTPHLDTGILPGITRELVLELAEQIGLPTEEGWYRWNAVHDSDEVFITNSIQEIVPIRSCFDVHGNETLIGNRVEGAGPWTRKLMEAYRRRTNES